MSSRFDTNLLDDLDHKARVIAKSLPEYIRERRPDAAIGLFWHIWAAGLISEVVRAVEEMPQERPKFFSGDLKRNLLI